MRGFKLQPPLFFVYLALVALYMSAWIEILIELSILNFELVALYMSAWIEIQGITAYLIVAYCRTLYECVD
ncbi:hypothetical protein CHH91_18805 [Virgibacillus sp. 7505]|nr:hypothetical protein CHH91_18805 [Virgibacillus sp. 7505]